MVPDKVTLFLFRKTCFFATNCKKVCIKLTYKGETKWNLNAMLFNIEPFTMEPFIKVLLLLKWSELTQLADHYKLTVASSSSMKNGKILQLILNYLREKELISDVETN